jgi:16S rRNA C1402 (ribose-2'-O) methylase RsmI
MQISIATVETRNFIFEGFGATAEEAEQALRKTLKTHAKQYFVREAKWVSETMADVCTRTVTLGTGYRDREEVKE